MIELSTDEVIMNNAVVPFSESSRPDLYVALIMEDGTFQRGPITLKKDERYKVTLVNPGEALPDVQYAIETTKGASFVGGGCDGNRRTHGRLSDVTPHELVVENTDQEIRVMAAWAGGHEAVQLTEELVFRPPNNNANDEKPAAEEKQPEEPKKHEEVIGIQVVEKHEPHDVNVERKNQELPAAENAHKDALEAELNVLKEEVKDIGKNHADIQDKVHNTIQRAKNHYDTNRQEDADRIQRLKDEKHGEDHDGTDKHSETIQRFKDSYREKHKEDEVKAKEHEMRKAEDPKHRETIKRFKEEFKKKHGIAEKKMLNHGEAGSKVLKRMHDAMRKDLTRRQPPRSFVQRLKGQYAQHDIESPFNMRSYVYGLIFFIVANVSILQLCLCLGKREKGHRHE